ncbi:MAG: type II restriction endonuclease BsuBI [Candidatus Tectimicrobiota bacterium]|nr:MAG: type II restriction endonuclease BsuBI [Candidatus Tectomicrobia bacterium]
MTAARDDETRLDLEEVKVLMQQLGLDRRLITDQSAICLLALADGVERQGLLPGKRRLRDGARIHDIIEFARQECGREVAENTRESYRKLSLQPLCEEGLVIRHQLSTNDPKTFYRLHPEMLRVLTCPAPLERRWLARELAARLAQGQSWKQQRRRAEIPVEVGQPQPFFLSPGAHSRLAAEVVAVYAPTFLRTPRVVYVGDTRHKGGYQNRDLMRELNLPLQVTAQLPDVILLCESERLLVVVEVVASSGPITPARLARLQALVRQPVAMGYRPRYVTAFPSRRVFRRFVEELAWGTQVWIAAEAEQVITFGTA